MLFCVLWFQICLTAWRILGGLNCPTSLGSPPKNHPYSSCLILSVGVIQVSSILPTLFNACSWLLSLVYICIMFYSIQVPIVRDFMSSVWLVYRRNSVHFVPEIIYTHTHTHLHKYIHTHMHKYIHICINKYIQIHKYIHTHMHKYIHICINTHICINS